MTQTIQRCHICGARAFQGANGWYVAIEGPDGSHRQPAAWSAEEHHATEAEAMRAHMRFERWLEQEGSAEA